MLYKSGLYLFSIVVFIASSIFWFGFSNEFIYSFTQGQLCLFLFGLASFSFLTILKAKSKVSYFDPLFYYPIIFVFYCGLGAITWTQNEYQSGPEIFVFYSLFMIFFIFGGITAQFTLFSKQSMVVKYELNYSRMTRCLIIVLVIGLLFQVLIFSKVGLVILSDNFQTERAKVIGKVGGFNYYFSLLIIDFIILTLVLKIVENKYLINKVFFLMSIVLCLLLLSLLGSRTRMIYPIFVSFLFLLLYRKDLITNSRLVLSACCLLFFILIYGSLRYITGEGGTFQEALSRIFLGELKLTATTFDMVVRGVPDKLDFLGLKVIIMPFLVILPQYDEVTVNILKEGLGLDYEGGGFTPSLVGSLYIISGWKSIIIGAFIWGWFLRKIYFNMLKGNVVHTLIYSYIFVYSLNVLKGGLFKDIEPFWHLTILIIIATICTKKVKLINEDTTYS